MLKGFREFVLRGNVIDLAVAVVIGAAFTLVINAIVQWLITPLIAAIFGQPDLDSVLNFTINGADFSIGAILSAIINFLLVAAAVYFVLIVPMNSSTRRVRPARRRSRRRRRTTSCCCRRSATCCATGRATSSRRGPP